MGAWTWAKQQAPAEVEFEDWVWQTAPEAEASSWFGGFYDPQENVSDAPRVAATGAPDSFTWQGILVEVMIPEMGKWGIALPRVGKEYFPQFYKSCLAPEDKREFDSFCWENCLIDMIREVGGAVFPLPKTLTDTSFADWIPSINVTPNLSADGIQVESVTEVVPGEPLPIFGWQHAIVQIFGEIGQVVCGLPNISLAGKTAEDEVPHREPLPASEFSWNGALLQLIEFVGAILYGLPGLDNLIRFFRNEQ